MMSLTFYFKDPSNSAEIHSGSLSETNCNGTSNWEKGWQSTVTVITVVALGTCNISEHLTYCLCYLYDLDDLDMDGPIHG